MTHTRKAQSISDAEAMAQRNARRLQIIKRVLGDKYAHHPANHVQRKPAQYASNEEK